MVGLSEKLTVPGGVDVRSVEDEDRALDTMLLVGVELARLLGSVLVRKIRALKNWESADSFVIDVCVLSEPASAVGAL